VEEGKRGMENSLGANLQEVRKQYEQRVKIWRKRRGEAIWELRVRRKSSTWRTRTRSN